MTARQTQKVIADLYRDITGQHLVFPTVREYFDSWVARKKPEIAPSSYHLYHEKARRFVNWLGNRADQQIALITRDDILGFRAVELERVAVSELKDDLQQDYERTYPDLGEIIRIVLDEEEAKAWELSFFPHLFLPDMVEAHIANLNL